MNAAVIEYERWEVRLRDGTTVLAKSDKNGLSALTYSNRTQAEKAAKSHGGEVIHRGRPFYVKLGKQELR